MDFEKRSWLPPGERKDVCVSLNVGAFAGHPRGRGK